MTATLLPEALHCALKLRDMSTKFKTPSHERGVCNEAIEILRTQHERITALEADRNMLQELLKNLADEFVRVYPIYYYAEPWAHNTNTVLITARTALEKTK